jgi:hypothetical protein
MRRARIFPVGGSQETFGAAHNFAKANASETRRCALKLKQLVAMAVVSGGLGLSAVGQGIGMAHAEPTSPSPAPTRPSKPPGPDLPPGVDVPPSIPFPLGPLIPDT